MQSRKLIQIDPGERAGESARSVAAQVALGWNQPAEKLVGEVIVVAIVDCGEDVDGGAGRRIADIGQVDGEFHAGGDGGGSNSIGGTTATGYTGGIVVVDGEVEVLGKRRAGGVRTNIPGRDSAGGDQANCIRRRCGGAGNLGVSAALAIDEISCIRSGAAAPSGKEMIVCRKAGIEGQADHVLAYPRASVEEVVLWDWAHAVFPAGLGINENIELIKIRFQVAGEHEVEAPALDRGIGSIQFAAA